MAIQLYYPLHHISKSHKDSLVTRFSCGVVEEGLQETQTTEEGVFGIIYQENDTSEVCCICECVSRCLGYANSILAEIHKFELNPYPPNTTSKDAHVPRWFCLESNLCQGASEGPYLEGESHDGCGARKQDS